MIGPVPTWLGLGVIAGVAVGALGLELAPRRTARAVAALPAVGGLATRECWRCDEPEIRPRVEEMPVTFRSSDVMDALTISFCTTCSVEMSLQERMDILHGETEKRANELLEADDE